MKAHMIAESLVVTALKILVRRVIGEQAVAKLESPYLSNITVKCRIKDKLIDIVDQMIAGVRK